ncbi:putative spermidine/putrescine transport system substrate-binding protein [Bradyrhizobium brasilense]|uniref:Putative spermidine/putrescine transport system substrate-binding protein n=1 Tax=Bradyrhizobium brasilense TaxID=1419277 RepID=A0A1G6U290_9BRAD|nr:ABC transporter substrate-binding protein [Bradyrhizobium brasilense]SDD35411.1 putative spermidine/putrescine transport system substrate-binding protein [Bradyrhizobium brasilense]
MDKRFTEISRRTLLAGSATLVAAPMVFGSRRAAANSDSVTMCNYGGSYQEATVKAVYDPFTKETGIKVNIIPFPGLDKVKAMQVTGNVDIDVWLGGGQDTAAGSKGGFWEKLDPALFDVQDMVIKPKSDYVTFETFLLGLAWDPAKYGQGKHPATFAEFFDVKKFPGRRMLRKAPVSSLEIALLGDGVAPKDIYPLDLNRAFRVFDRIKSNTVWAHTNPQTISLLQTGEVDFGISYAGRVKSTTEPGAGVPLAFSFEQNIINDDCLAIVKGAPNKENAIKLIAYYLQPEVQARLYNLVAVTPGSKKAAAMLSPEMRKWQPDPNNANNRFVDNDYWAENYNAVSRRFQEWLMT